MNSKLFLAIFLISLIECTYGQSAQCNGEDIKVTPEQITNFKECLTETGLTSFKEMPEDKKPCFVKCIINKKGLVDDDGKPHKEKIVASMNEKMPDAAKTELQPKIEKCLDDNASKVDPKEAECKSYLDVGVCLMQAYADVCKPK